MEKSAYNFEKIYHKWFSVFKENLFVFDYNDVKTNPQHVLDEVLHFLNLDKKNLKKEVNLTSVNGSKIKSWPQNHIKFLEEFLKEYTLWYENKFPRI